MNNFLQILYDGFSGPIVQYLHDQQQQKQQLQQQNLWVTWPMNIVGLAVTFTYCYCIEKKKKKMLKALYVRGEMK